jgi:hypothetical protein
MTEPQYQHDCDRCVFLGRATAPEQDMLPLADLWLCPCDSGAHTLIRRYSSEGSDYASGPIKGSLQDARTWQRDASYRRAEKDENPIWKRWHDAYEEAMTFLSRGEHSHLMPTVVYHVFTGEECFTEDTFEKLEDAHSYAVAFLKGVGGTSWEYAELERLQGAWNIMFGGSPGGRLTVGYYIKPSIWDEEDHADVTISRLLVRTQPFADRDVALRISCAKERRQRTAQFTEEMQEMRERRNTRGETREESWEATGGE